GGSTRELTEVMARCDVADHDQHDRPVRRRAHLTVARSGARSHEVDLGVLVRALSVYDGPEWTVDRLQLISSRLGEGPGGGPLHEVVDEFPFSAGHGVQSSVV
ncbi:MAG: hypothetical protein L0G99_09705, partial [Propionibacteriales bacterium]|nr:hypothetical protein [Propionibacteriales bacterium]